MLQIMSLTKAMYDFFGYKEGEGFTNFSEEINQLCKDDKEELARLLSEKSNAMIKVE